MKKYSLIILVLLTCFSTLLQAQEDNNSYIEFNDRNNTVHGVYMGLGFHYGQIDKSDTYLNSFKVAYVANQKFEIGFIGVGFYSDLNRLGLGTNDEDLVGAYGGLHLEPILFSKSKFNLSFPLLVGAGATALIDGNLSDNDIDDNDDWAPIFVIEPGMSVLYNISRFIQLETGIKYRLSSKVNLNPDDNIDNINGFSVGLGVKIGIFNMGRNRYKKKLTN